MQPMPTTDTILNQRPSTGAMFARIAFSKLLLAAQERSPLPVWLMYDAEAYSRPFTDAEWGLINARLAELAKLPPSPLGRAMPHYVEIDRLSYTDAESGEGEGTEHRFLVALQRPFGPDDWELSSVHYKGADITHALTTNELNAICYAVAAEKGRQE